jgi:predicted phosphodiesterase
MNAFEMAVIADVHGNADALAVVLADIARRGVKNVVNLGDNANGPLDPARAVALLQACDAIHVRGNGDRMTGEGGATARKSALYARERLDDRALRWLRELPMVVRGDDWVAFHATPASDEEYFLENVADGKTVLANDAEISSRLGSVSESLVLCGHSHIPRVVRLRDGRTVLNPGSIGLPAYADDAPSPHVVETGSPHARYAIARRADTRWEVELHALVYDWNSAATAARAAGWSEWARILETGRASF